MQRFLLLTTSIVTENTEKLERMIDSLRGYHASSDIQIKHVLLLQKTSEEQAKALSESLSFPEWTQVLSDERMLPLSVARNIMLNHVHASSEVIDNDTVVAFPDDDCWYPEGFLIGLTNIVNQSHSDFFFCCYGTETESIKLAQPIKIASYRDLVFNASSNTLFIRSSVVKQVGYFNENLGVGARFNGGEDLDYALRAYRRAGQTVFCSSVLVGHRDKMTTLRGSYYTGSALALRNNALYSLSATMQFIRKIAIGVYLVLKREMPIRKLITVFIARYKESNNGT